MTETNPFTDRIGKEPIGRLLINFSIPAIIGMFVKKIKKSVIGVMPLEQPHRKTAKN